MGGVSSWQWSIGSFKKSLGLAFNCYSATTKDHGIVTSSKKLKDGRMDCG